MSLGVYNTQTGAGADVGFTFDNAQYFSHQQQQWALYANSASGWRSGSTVIDASKHACVSVRVSALDTPANSLNVTVMDLPGRVLLGYDIIEHLDADLHLNAFGMVPIRLHSAIA